jgi:electron transport complex protein RnfB
VVEAPPKRNRREFLRDALRAAGLLLGAGALGGLAGRARADDYVWQLDPEKCNQCGQCATHCVLTPSAVKVVHQFAMCGYCKLCFGFFRDERPGDSEAAEDVRCPTGAIKRRFVEDPYFQYTIDESLCIGCAKCVKGCQAYGNGSLYLQTRYDRCLNCNQCSIAAACPAQAWVRVPRSKPYIMKTRRANG